MTLLIRELRLLCVVYLLDLSLTVMPDGLERGDLALAIGQFAARVRARRSQAAPTILPTPANVIEMQRRPRVEGRGEKPTTKKPVPSSKPL